METDDGRPHSHSPQHLDRRGTARARSGRTRMPFASRRWPRLSASAREASTGTSTTARALLEEMLDTWERVVIDEAIERVEAGGGDARAKLERLFALASSPEARALGSVDLAVRHWGPAREAVAERLRRVDNRRMEYMRSLFAALSARTRVRSRPAACSSSRVHRQPLHRRRPWAARPRRGRGAGAEAAALLAGRDRPIGPGCYMSLRSIWLLSERSGAGVRPKAGDPGATARKFFALSGSQSGLAGIHSAVACVHCDHGRIPRSARGRSVSIARYSSR